MNEKLKILSFDLLNDYKLQINKDLNLAFKNLKDADISTKNFSFYTSVAAVFSSKIEGEEIELDSYINHKKFGISFLPDYTQKIDDLYNAYNFAKDEPLTKKNIETAHQLLSTHILAKEKRGEIRTQNMYVTTADGKIEYVATSPFEVLDEMKNLYSDIAILIKQTLSIDEVFFFAAMIHLVFVKIHPWNDGNGRCARLIEKWFIAQKLGSKAWFINSERNYYLHHQIYYNNLRALGVEYETLNYANALPFLLMLPNAL